MLCKCTLIRRTKSKQSLGADVTWCYCNCSWVITVVCCIPRGLLKECVFLCHCWAFFQPRWSSAVLLEVSEQYSVMSCCMTVRQKQSASLDWGHSHSTSSPSHLQTHLYTTSRAAKQQRAVSHIGSFSCIIIRSVGLGCVLCPRINPLHFLAGCHRRRLNQGLVVALGFFLVR